MDVRAWATSRQLNVEGILRVARENTEEGAIHDSAIIVEDGERYFISYIYSVARGSWGNEIKFRECAKDFDLNPTILDSCSDWPEIESRADAVAEWLTEQAMEEGMNGEFYYWHNEADGDFELLYRIPLGKEEAVHG